MMPRRDPRRPLTEQEGRVIQELFEQVITAFEARAGSVDSNFTELQGKLDAVDIVLRGGHSGDDGLVTKVSNLNIKFEQLRMTVNEIKGQNNKFLWWIIGILVAVVGSLLATFVLGRLIK